MNANVLTDLRWLEYYCSPRDEGGSQRLPVSFRYFFCPSLNPSFRTYAFALTWAVSLLLN